MPTLGPLNGPFPAPPGQIDARTLKRDPDCPQNSLGPGVLGCGVAHGERPKTGIFPHRGRVGGAQTREETTWMADERGERTAPAAAAGAAAAVAPIEPFETWASTQRRRATLDGAWKVVVTERVVDGTTTRSVASWHDNAKQPGTPVRRAQQHGNDASGRLPQQQDASRDQPAAPARQSSRQRRSASRSAVHHRWKKRLRVLRKVQLLLAVRCLVRLSRLTAKGLALRDVSSPGKRRHSPPPPEATCGPIRLWAPDSVALPPPPKRAEPQTSWLERTLLRVQRARNG